MDERRIVIIAIGIILIGVFNLLFFVLTGGTVKPCGWVQYYFTNIGFTLWLVVGLFESGYTTYVLKFTTQAIVGVYVIITIVLCTVAILIGVENLKIIVSLNVVLLAACCTTSGINMMVNLTTEQSISHERIERW